MNDSPTDSYSHWNEMLADPRYSPSSGALQDYLSLTVGLESPTPYHIWSFLSLTAALCGDSIALTHGPMGRERLNLGVVLTGVPALRKSSALSVMQRFAEGLPIAYGPTDTAGQRQGIMSAMMPKWQRDAQDEDNPPVRVETIQGLADFDTDDITASVENPVTRRASEIYFVSKELGRLISGTSRELFDFFTDGMDGESFHYQLKNQTIKIKKPLINLIGATTPSSLGHLLPRGGESHGFLSRLIFVHASRVSRKIALPEEWSDQQRHTKERLHELLHTQLERKHEVVDMSPAAAKTYKELYDEYAPLVSDVRLQAYQGRRPIHLLKVSALLAVLRGEDHVRVQASDVRLAHGILTLTEGSMDRAFYGLDTGFYSRVLSAITELAEGSSDGTVTMQAIQSYASHLGELEQLTRIVMSLENQGKLVGVKSNNREATFALSTVAEDASLSRVRLAFKAGGIPAPDEYTSFKAAKPQIVTQKGAAG
jgi:hypothetical protein